MRLAQWRRRALTRMLVRIRGEQRCSFFCSLLKKLEGIVQARLRWRPGKLAALTGVLLQREPEGLDGLLQLLRAALACAESCEGNPQVHLRRSPVKRHAPARSQHKYLAVALNGHAGSSAVAELISLLVESRRFLLQIGPALVLLLARHARSGCREVLSGFKIT